MITRNLALATIAVGVVTFVAGIYGLVGPDFSLTLAGFGLFALIAGTAFLWWISRQSPLSAPHPYVLGISVVAAGLHVYEYLFESSDGAPVGFMVWQMVPYVVCLTLAAFPATRVPSIAGAALALIFDSFGHYSVFVNPQGSTAALALLFIPLWNTVIVVPLATFVAWYIARRRSSS